MLHEIGKDDVVLDGNVSSETMYLNILLFSSFKGFFFNMAIFYFHLTAMIMQLAVWVVFNDKVAKKQASHS